MPSTPARVIAFTSSFPVAFWAAAALSLSVATSALLAASGQEGDPASPRPAPESPETDERDPRLVAALARLASVVGTGERFARSAPLEVEVVVTVGDKEAARRVWWIDPAGNRARLELESQGAVVRCAFQRNGEAFAVTLDGKAVERKEALPIVAFARKTLVADRLYLALPWIVQLPAESATSIEYAPPSPPAAPKDGSDEGAEGAEGAARRETITLRHAATHAGAGGDVYRLEIDAATGAPLALAVRWKAMSPEQQDLRFGYGELRALDGLHYAAELRGDGNPQVLRFAATQGSDDGIEDRFLGVAAERG
jgi:hypothetical protein